MSKGLDALKDLYETMPIAFNVCNVERYFEIIEKELKALEIILNYVPLNIIRSYLEKEEQNLLKEVLQ